MTRALALLFVALPAVAAASPDPKLPSFPRLSADGATAVVDLSRSPSEPIVYDVAFLDDKLEHVKLVDDATAKQIEEGRIQQPKLDGGKLRSLAKRLDAFTPFGKVIGWDALLDAKSSLVVGTARLVWTGGSGDGTLNVRLVDRKSGDELESITVPDVPRGKGTGECGSSAQLRTVYADTKRKRVLLGFSYLTGGDACRGAPASALYWKLWKLRS